jgi:hypothetical protein
MTAMTEDALSVAERSKRALAEGLRATGTACNERGYVGRPEENVLHPDEWPAIACDLNEGAGDELARWGEGYAPKFCAAHWDGAKIASQRQHVARLRNRYLLRV